MRRTILDFKEYLNTITSKCFRIEPLTSEERLFWLNEIEVLKRVKRYNKFNIKDETNCYVLFDNEEDSIYDIISLLLIYKSVNYLTKCINDIPVEIDQDIHIYTISRMLNDKEYYSFLKIDNRSYETNEITKPRVSDNLDDYQIIDRSTVDYEKYMLHIGQAMVTNCISVQFSRGCQFGCAYCQKVYLNTYRNRSAENLYEEILKYYKIGIQRFAFVDDLPNFNRGESIKLFKKIYENKLKIQLFFPNGIRGDILDHEYIDYMIQAGTVNIDLALETASPRLQKLINKNLNIEKLRNNLEYLIAEYPEVILELQMMIGLPTETGEEAQSSMQFIEGLKWIDFPYMHILKIYPNTPMANLALQYGISKEAIESSNDLGYHELPNTLPFSKLFVKKCQSQFLNKYFLDKNRLQSVLPKQAKIMTEKELIQKYDSYLPVVIEDIETIKELAGITELECVPENKYFVDNLNSKIRNISPVHECAKESFRVLFIDLTLLFEECTDKIYHVIEPPLGQMYILSYLKKKMGKAISGKIIKSGIDFKNYYDLKKIIADYDPNFIGLRGMNYYKYFLHFTVNLIRQWGYMKYIAVGGPYATSAYKTLLNDENIDFAMIGEGEETCLNVVKCLMANEIEQIKDIAGVVMKERNAVLKTKMYFIDFL